MTKYYGHRSLVPPLLCLSFLCLFPQSCVFASEVISFKNPSLWVQICTDLQHCFKYIIAPTSSALPSFSFFVYLTMLKDDKYIISLTENELGRMTNSNIQKIPMMSKHFAKATNDLSELSGYWLWVALILEEIVL